MNKTKHFSVWVPQKTRDRLFDHAEKDMRSVNEVVELAILDFCKMSKFERMNRSWAFKVNNQKKTCSIGLRTTPYVLRQINEIMEFERRKRNNLIHLAIEVYLSCN